MRSRPLALLACLLALYGSLSLLWPGDVPFMGDEAGLMSLAAEGAGHGLLGSRGVVYGPFAVWVYRALLWVTHDLAVVVLLRTLLFFLGCGVSIVWLAETIPALFAPIGALALLSTYGWFYARGLWDNTFLIPLSWVTVASYASFGKAPRPWKLALAGAGCAGMLLTHLMCLPLIAALALHAAWRHGKWLKARAPGVAAGLLVLGAACAPYLSELAAGPRPAPPSPALSAWQGWVFPWLGGRMFSAWGLEYFFGEGWSWGWARPAAWLSMASIPLMWVGLAASLRERRDEGFHLALVGLITLCFQSVFYGTLRLYRHPHYYDPGWPLYFYFVWRALSLAPRWPVLAAAQLVSAAVLAFTIRDVHVYGGTRSRRYGPTLDNQLDIARALAAYHPESPLSTRTLHYGLFPETIPTLQRLYGLHATESGPRRPLAIVYAEDDPRSGRVAVVVGPSPLTRPGR